MKILHVSFDIPDEFISDKTVAIKNLIKASDMTGNYNFYFSLNRGNDRKNKTSKIVCKDHISIKRFGYPAGIGLINFLTEYYKDIVSSKSDISNFNLIHGHKLTYEGYIAYLINEKYHIPYCVSIRFTDFKVIKYRADLKGIYKRVLENAQKIFCIAPWMINELKRLFGENFIENLSNKIVVLPNIIENKDYEFKDESNEKYVTIFKITRKNLQRKNIYRTLKAIKDLNLELDIIGDGEAKEQLQKFIEKNNLQKNVTLLGGFDNEIVLEKLKEYKAMILCSYPETFGLVYIEALIKGIPIIYTQNAGIDGFFNNDSVGEGVKYKSIDSIKESINKIDTNYYKYKSNVLRIQKDGTLLKFTFDNVSELYNSTISNIRKD